MYIIRGTAGLGPGPGQLRSWSGPGPGWHGRARSSVPQVQLRPDLGPPQIRLTSPIEIRADERVPTLPSSRSPPPQSDTDGRQPRIYLVVDSGSRRRHDLLQLHWPRHHGSHSSMGTVRIRRSSVPVLSGCEISLPSASPAPSVHLQLGCPRRSDYVWRVSRPGVDPILA